MGHQDETEFHATWILLRIPRQLPCAVFEISYGGQETRSLRPIESVFMQFLAQA